MKTCYVDYATRSIADLCDYDGKGLILTRINVPKSHRGKGHARRLLQEILKDADHEGITLYLQISPSDGLDYDQLHAWYERHGFQDMGGVWRRKPMNNIERHDMMAARPLAVERIAREKGLSEEKVQELVAMQKKAIALAQELAITELTLMLGRAPSEELVGRCTSDAETCPVDECMICSVRDCPGKEALHYHHDGCPYCQRGQGEE